MFTLDQIHTLLAVYESGSFSAAARKLGKAQSGISQTIANLEIDLDKPLFIREKGGITPTENLLELLPAIRRLLRQAEILEQKLTALSHDEPLQFSIAIEEGLWNADVVRLIHETAARYPQMELELLLSSTFDIEQLIATGKVQLGVLYLDNKLDPTADAVYLGNYQFISVAHPDNPLAKQARLDLPTLMQHRHIVHRSLSKKAMSFSPPLSENCWYCNDYQTLHHLVKQNAGWADLPEKMVAEDLKAGRLVRLPLDFEPEGNRVQVMALRSASHRHDLVSSQFIEVLRAFLSP